MGKMQAPAIMCVHDDDAYMVEAIQSFAPFGPVLVFVNQIPWHGPPGCWERVKERAEQVGAEVVTGEWHGETEHRRAALAEAKSRGWKHIFIPDTDEIIEPELAKACLTAAKAGLADRIFVEMDTYWKTPAHRIRPREQIRPLIMLNAQTAEHVHIREYAGGKTLLLGADHGVLHHLSYAGPDSRILRKISTWSHRDEVDPAWLQRSWRGWDSDHLLRNLHPTHPEAYHMVERTEAPELLLPAMDRWRKLSGLDVPGMPEPPERLPKVSVVIPVLDGSDDLFICLESLKNCEDLLHEVIVVDNGSQEDIASLAKPYKFVKIIRNEVNRGFAGASNQGAEAATGDVILFLNSDTAVPRACLIRLVESLMSSGSVGAVGPYTNACGHFQLIKPTYTSLANLEPFAIDFAHRAEGDRDVDMLVGFCMAVKKSVLDEVGLFDEAFGIGTFEDNDLCYRIRRAGYSLLIAARSFVHHKGSATIRKVGPKLLEIVAENEKRYRQKWARDLETGFATSLSGLSAEPIQFDKSKRPEELGRSLKAKVEQADISLIMIVKNEERVLGDCLASAKPFFKEMIVVDTGSTDRTREIAESHGAKVIDFPWTDSFSEARNVSVKHASGKWVFWLDADDTLPFPSGQAILEAAIQSPENIYGYIVPVQFVEGGSAGATRVDHVKLIRNFEGLEFRFHIHEQVLGAIREAGGEIARIEGSVVLHSGYDTSEEGQARKRVRDEKLLKLDLKENPDHPFVLFNLGMTAHYTGDQEAAIKWLKKCLKVSGKGESHVRKAHALLVMATERKEGEEAAAKLTQKALEETGPDAELEFHAGRLALALGDPDKAISHYHRCLEIDAGGYLSSFDRAIQGYKAFCNLGIAHGAKGDWPEARKWLDMAWKEAPMDQNVIDLLADACLKLGDVESASQLANSIFIHSGYERLWLEISMKVAEARGDAGALQFLQREVVEQPNFYEARRQLARRLLERELHAAARPHLLFLTDRGDPEAAYLLGVVALRAGAVSQAHRWMSIAHELNPEHEQTRQQLAAIESVIQGQGAS